MNVPKIDKNVRDINIERAMKYACNRRHGYMKELRPFGEGVVNSMKSTGFLKTGWTEQEETFGATEMLQKYVKVVFGKVSFMERLQFLAHRISVNCRNLIPNIYQAKL